MPRPENRTRDLAQIHCLKRDLALEQEAYEDCCGQVVAGTCSSISFDAAQRRALIALLQRRKGPHKPQRPTRSKKTRLPRNARPQYRKIVALWITLGHEGVIRDPSDQALQTYIKRMTGVDHLRWLDIEQASTVIESLKQWQARVHAPAARSKKSHRKD